MSRANQLIEKLTRQMIARFGTKADKKKLYKKNEVAPPGFEGTVKAMKKRHPEIDNPWALAWSMKNKGYKSHKKKTGGPKVESVLKLAGKAGERLASEIVGKEYGNKAGTALASGLALGTAGAAMALGGKKKRAQLAQQRQERAERRKNKHEDRETHDLAYAMYDRGPLAKKKRGRK